MGDTKWADVAHYYSASQIQISLLPYTINQVVTGNIEVNEGTHKAHSFDVGGNCTYLYDDNPNARGTVRIGKYKPILRHLEDMIPDFYDRTPTDEEDATADRIWQELWDVVFPESTQDKDEDVFEITMGGMWRMRRGSELLLLNEFGEMYAMNFNGQKEFNAAGVTHVLIREGFDVFGLIESGQAIRK